MNAWHAGHVNGDHLVGRTEIVPFVNGETIAISTVHDDRVTQEAYAFLHQVWAPLETLEEVLSRDVIGFKKHFNITWFASHSQATRQVSEASHDLNQGYPMHMQLPFVVYSANLCRLPE